MADEDQMEMKVVNTSTIDADLMPTTSIGYLTNECRRLRNAIRLHRDQRGDDRCWMDDQALYDVLPEKVKGNAQSSPEEMLTQCKKFIERRHNPTQEYLSPVAIIKKRIEEIDKLINDIQATPMDSRDYLENVAIRRGMTELLSLLE